MFTHNDVKYTQLVSPNAKRFLSLINISDKKHKIL